MKIDANFRGAKPYDHTHLHFIDCHNFFENGINRTEMFSALIPMTLFVLKDIFIGWKKKKSRISLAKTGKFDTMKQIKSYNKSL